MISLINVPSANKTPTLAIGPVGPVKLGINLMTSYCTLSIIVSNVVSFILKLILIYSNIKLKN